jgi:hypothetical protein
MTNQQILEGDILIRGNLTIEGALDSNEPQTDGTRALAEVVQLKEAMGVSLPDGTAPVTGPALEAGTTYGRIVVLRWIPPAYTGPAFLEYEYQISRDAVAWYAVGTSAWNGDQDATTQAGQTTQAVIPGLPLDGTVAAPQETVYKFRVRGFLGDQRTPWSNIANATVGPYGPGDIVAGAIERAKLEAGFLDEHDAAATTLFPNGIELPSVVDILTPREAIDSGMIEYLADLIATTEEGLHSTMVQTSGNATKISSIEQTIDEINLTVSELYGGTVDITLWTQTKNKIDMVALTGQYDDLGTTLDTWMKANIDVIATKVALVVEDKSGGGYQVASTIITADQIASVVASAITGDPTVHASISTIVQESDAIQLTVQALRDETIERLDESHIESQAGILITKNLIELSVQRIDGDLAQRSTITQTADAINAAVSTAITNQGIYYDAQLAIRDTAISARVRAERWTGSAYEEVPGGAFLQLSLTLPAILTVDRYNAIRAKIAEPAAIDYAYSLTTGEIVGQRYNTTTHVLENVTENRYHIQSDVETAAYPPNPAITKAEALRNNLKTAGLLSSQIAMEAEEILLKGTIRAEHMELESASVGIFNAAIAHILDGTIDKLTSDHIDVNTITAKSVEIINGNFEIIQNDAGIFVWKGSSLVFHVNPNGSVSMGSGKLAWNHAASKLELQGSIDISGITAGDAKVLVIGSVVELSASYLQVYHFTILATGSVRVTAEFYRDPRSRTLGNYQMDVVCKKNGAQQGSAQTTTLPSWDVNVAAGDIITLEAKTSGADSYAIQNGAIGVGSPVNLVMATGGPH